MLISRQELEFDFQGATFDTDAPGDRRLLGWIFNQFLYGEVTGIQCGHWLYRAPHLNAASFLARQATEELSHVRKILRILSLLDETPARPHWAIRFMATGMMGGSWGEHVTLEMALGEGLVLTLFYALARTVDHPETHRLLESAASDEERHVEFGERETRSWLSAHPETRSYLLGKTLVQYWAMQRLKASVERRVLRGAETAGHPVLSQLGSFYDHTVQMFETRAMRLGLSERPLRELGTIERAGLLLRLPWGKLRTRVGCRSSLLTSTYLDDPVVSAERERDRPPS